MATATTRLLGTAISPEYVRDWNIPMAIRELLQNLLDTKKEFGASGAARYNKKQGIAELRDDGPGLELRHLALGISEKGAASVGQFGEGLKLALLLFARENRFIEVRSKDYRLTPLIKESEFGTETLFFEVEELGSYVQGTIIRFRCSQEELNEGKSYFPTEFKVSSEHRVSWVLKDKISLPGGRVFVNGSLVTTLENALFSYHLWGEKAKGISNRDRTIVDHDSLVSLVRDTITSEEDIPVQWFQKILEGLDSERDIWESNVPPHTFKENLGKAFDKVFGPKAAVSGGSAHHDQLVARLGFKPVYIPDWNWRWLLLNSSPLLTVAAIVREKPLSTMVDIIPEDKLSTEEQERLHQAIDLVEKYFHSPVRPLKVVKTLDEVVGSGVNGVYNTGEDTIYIAYKELWGLEKVVETVLHETVHKATGAADLTPRFQKAQDTLSAGLLLELAGERA
jgi:hypothetical protein